MRNDRLLTLARLAGCGMVILVAGSFVSHSIGTAPLGDPLGACCLDGGGDCQLLSSAACADAGGFYLGDGVNCGEAECPSIPDCAAKLCPQDLTGDAIVDVSDLLAVLSEWGACADCPADFNRDGTVNTLDLLNLLTAWGECPDSGGIVFNENEPCGAALNDGCNTVPPQFGELCCGDTVLGTVWAEDGMRDLDVFVIHIEDLAEQTTVAFDIEHDFAGGQAEVFIANSSCPLDLIDVEISASPFTLGEVLPPGTYIVAIRPETTDGLPCAADPSNTYTITMTCIPHTFCQDNCGGVFFDPITGFFCTCEEGCDDWGDCCPGACDSCPDLSHCGEG